MTPAVDNSTGKHLLHQANQKLLIKSKWHFIEHS